MARWCDGEMVGCTGPPRAHSGGRSHVRLTYLSVVMVAWSVLNRWRKSAVSLLKRWRSVALSVLNRWCMAALSMFKLQTPQAQAESTAISASSRTSIPTRAATTSETPAVA